MTLPLVMAVAWGVLVAGLGAWLTKLTPWYYALRRPPWQPPDWAFGPAWTIILALASAAAFLAWRHAPDFSHRILVAGVFLANGALNIVWSPLFFTLRRPDWALVEVPFLWLSILAMIVLLAPLSRLSAWLLVPYLAWVSFAAALNVAVVRRNRPFGA